MAQPVEPFIHIHGEQRIFQSLCSDTISNITCFIRQENSGKIKRAYRREGMVVKRIKKLFLILCLLFCSLNVCPDQAVASENSAVLVSIESDSDEYSAGDIAVFSVTISNDTASTAEDVNWIIDLPSSLSPLDECPVEGTIDEISSGESVTRTIKANVDQDTALDGNGTNEDDAVSNGNRASEDIPQTGDSAIAITATLAAVGVSLLVLGLVFKHKKFSNCFAIILCLAALGAASFPVDVYASEGNIREASASCSIDVNGTKQSVTASISYVMVEQADVSDDGDGNYTYVLQEDVTQLDDYDVNGNAFTYDSVEYSLSIGSKVVLAETDSNPFGAAGTIVGIVDNGDGTVTAQFEQATDPAEVFQSLYAHDSGVKVGSRASVEGSREDVNSREGVSSRAIVDEEGQWTPSDGEIGDSFDVSLGGGSYIRGSFGVEPILSYEIKWSLLSGLEICDLKLEGEAEARLRAHLQNEDANKDIPIATVNVPIAYGFAIDVPVYAHVTVEGDIEVSVTYSMDTSIELVGEDWVISDNSDFGSEANAAVHARLGGKVGAEFKWFEITIVDAAIEAGADGTASSIVRDTGMVCSDLSVYAYAGAEVGLKTDWLTFMGWTYDDDFIDESNSPLKLALHWEDGEEVPECTYGKDAPDVDDPDVDDPDNPDIPSGFEDDGSIHPELPDNGDGTEVKLDGASGYGNRLEEAFNVYEGTSITVTASEEETTVNYTVDLGTVIRITQLDYDSNAYVSEVTCWPGYAYQVADGYCTIEVLCGRINVYSLQSWGGRPSVTKGTCEIIPYPLRLSRLSLDMQVGETYQLRTENSFDILSDYEDSLKTKFEWRSSDPDVVKVDEDGNIEAVSSGTAVVTVYNPNWQVSYFSRSCTVTVE